MDALGKGANDKHPNNCDTGSPVKDLANMAETPSRRVRCLKKTVSILDCE
jgi:hypothetical protein